MSRVEGRETPSNKTRFPLSETTNDLRWIEKADFGLRESSIPNGAFVSAKRQNRDNSRSELQI